MSLIPVVIFDIFCMNYSYLFTQACERDMMMQVNSLFHIKPSPGFGAHIVIGRVVDNV